MIELYEAIEDAEAPAPEVTPRQVWRCPACGLLSFALKPAYEHFDRCDLRAVKTA